MKMKTQLIMKDEEILSKLSIYTFLQKFYSSDLITVKKTIWEEISGLINEEVSVFSNENLKKGSQMISNLNDYDWKELEFDFNQLFVGPNRLEAAPYESVYRNTDRALMQTETMAVRKFYERAGLILSKKNNDPEDHLSLELEFVCYLLQESIDDDFYYPLYESFLNLHLFHWVEEHCELVREKTTNTLITGVSYILQGMMEVERQQLNIPRRSKK